MAGNNHLKIPPHSIEDEQSVIGGVFVSGLPGGDGSAWEKVSGMLTPEDFYRQDHGLIFMAMMRLAEDNQPLDVVTVQGALKASGHLDKVGGAGVLYTLVKDTPSAANIKAYATTVRNHSIRRQMIRACQEQIAKAFELDASDEAVQALVEDGVNAMFSLEQKKVTADTGLKPLKPAVKARLDRMSALNDSGRPSSTQLNGVSTGIDALDMRWSGLEKKKYYLGAARPGIGKTTFSLQIAEHVAFNHQDQFVAVFSLEMDIDELAEKFMACSGRADYGHIRQPWMLADDDWARLGTGIKRLGQSNIMVDDSSELKPSHIRQRVRRMMFESGKTPALIVVDYLQLMSGEKKSYPNREAEIAEISRGMKRLAKDFNVPVLALSQLNRGLENRVNKRPVLADLRESGSLEQDANVVMFLYRESVYDDECGHNNAELITAKVRGGVPGTDTTLWQGKYQRFENLASEGSGAGRW